MSLTLCHSSAICTTCTDYGISEKYISWVFPFILMITNCISKPERKLGCRNWLCDGDIWLAYGCCSHSCQWLWVVYFVKWIRKLGGSKWLAICLYHGWHMTCNRFCFPSWLQPFAQVPMYYGMQELPHEVGLEQHTRLRVLQNVWSFWATWNATTWTNYYTC